ncbi:MAG: MATE family efflux transporter [Fusobacteriaceae bacterium]|jgi:putative MATE family efflux protein|nr:MATE family efflux transporter [Fusobacteriaceae bacterium]
MKSTKAADILHGSIWKQLLIFFFPIMLGTFFQQVYNTADTIIVGRYVGKEALAAVGGSPFYIMNIFISFSIGLSSGCSVIIAQYFGAAKKKHLSKAIHTSLALSILLGIAISVSVYLSSEPLLRWLRVPADAFDYSVRYLKIVSLGFSLTMVYNMCTAIFRAIGDSKTPLYFLMVCAVLNIGLNILLVAIFRLNVAGVAIATVISQFVSVFLSFFSLMRTKEIYRVRLSELKIYGPLVPKLIRTALPRALQSTYFSLANVILQSSINLLGTSAVAGWAIDRKIEVVFSMIIGSFGVAITVFTAQNFGARQYDRVRRGLVVCFQINIVITVILSVVTWLWGPSLSRFFSDDPLVLEHAVTIIRFLSPFYLLYVAYELIACYLYGIGISFTPMLITSFGICVFRILWIFIVIGKTPTLYRILGCYPVSWGLTSLLFLIYFKCSKRRKALLN